MLLIFKFCATQYLFLSERLNHMKATIALFVMQIFAVLSFAQKKVILHYSYTQNLAGRTATNFLDQYYDKGRSIEFPVARQKMNDTTIYNGSSVTKNIYLPGNKNKIPFLLKNPASKSLIYAESIWMKAPVLVIDSLNNFKWKISEETKSIDDILCVKAEAFFRGRNYYAWFKYDQDIQTGPWKFGGLPGIIYEIADASGSFKYNLTGFEFTENFAAELKVPDAYADDQMMTHQDFISLWKTVKQDAEKNNGKVDHTLTGSSSIKHFVAPLKELY